MAVVVPLVFLFLPRQHQYDSYVGKIFGAPPTTGRGEEECQPATDRSREGEGSTAERGQTLSIYDGGGGGGRTHFGNNFPRQHDDY